MFLDQIKSKMNRSNAMVEISQNKELKKPKTKNQKPNPINYHDDNRL